MESELLTGLYSEEEKAQILGQIEEAASANRLTVDIEAFQPRKRGILFPVLVNVAALALIVGAWFGADAYFQTRQQDLRLKTDKIFSTESKLLTKVLEDAKVQMAAKDAEIEKIQGDLAKMAAEKANLQKSFENRVNTKERELRQELASALEAEKKRLQEAGLGAEEITRRLKEFEAQKNAEFNSRLETYRRQVQGEIDQRTQALNALQSKLQSTVLEQEKLRQDIERQTKERERDLQGQLSNQAADLEGLKRSVEALTKEKEELNNFYRQADVAVAAVRSAFDSGDWVVTQAAVLSLRQVLAKASASASELVRSRAQAQLSLAEALDTAAVALGGSSSKAQAKKEQALAALQLGEIQKTLADTEAKWRQAEAVAEDLRKDVARLVVRLDEGTTETFDSRIEAQYLTAKVRELERTIEVLLPYRDQVQTLTDLFEAKYSNAKSRFVTTFGSQAGQTLFPQFDQAWQDLSRQVKKESSFEASRQQALEEVLTYTTYLRGASESAQNDKDTSEKLARTDANYRQVVESIQALMTTGAVEPGVSTAQSQLYGTVAAVSGTKIILEPLTKVKPQEGQTMEVRRVQGKRETVLGRGKVLSAASQRVEIDWTGNDLVPLSGDSTYLVLP